MTQFDEHKRCWFLNRVGEIVVKQFTVATPSSVIKASSATTLQICSKDHALALYNYHRDNKVNFIPQNQ